jgi:hypothetical protein
MKLLALELSLLLDLGNLLVSLRVGLEPTFLPFLLDCCAKHKTKPNQVNRQRRKKKGNEVGRIELKLARADTCS